MMGTPLGRTGRGGSQQDAFLLNARGWLVSGIGQIGMFIPEPVKDGVENIALRVIVKDGRDLGIRHGPERDVMEVEGVTHCG